MIGAAAAGVAVVYAGSGAVAQALERLHWGGLMTLAFLHLPVVVLMGFAWRLAAGDRPPASTSRFLWARFVRDAAGEALPFLYLGGLLFGVRALGRGGRMSLSAVSACIDGVMELAAKLPYVLAALLTLLAMRPQTHVTRLLSVALAATGVIVTGLVIARRSLPTSLGAMVRAINYRWPALPFLGGDAGLDVQACFERILHQRTRLWSAFALHFGCWCLGAGEAWVTFRMLGLDLTLSHALAIDGAVVGLRTFGFLVPAAAGVQELSYILAGAMFGIPPAAALAASFARRARDLMLAVATLSIATIGDARSALLRFRY